VDVPVLIAGGGPVGMMLALDLGWRGVPCLLVEQSQRELSVPRCNTISARTMEHFRRLGIARAVRSAGLPNDYPTDVSYRTRFCGPELYRISQPSAAQVLEQTDRGEDQGLIFEPQHRLAQLFLEPILLEHSRRFPCVSIERGVQLESFTERPDGITATLRSITSGATRTVEAGFLVGCDGARSLVRQTLDARFEGVSAVCQAVSLYIRAPRLAELNRPRTWMTWSVNSDALFVTVAIDGRDLWLVHAFLPVDTDTGGLLPEDLIRQAIGQALPHELLGVERWTGRRLVASRYGEGRVFIAGDAAHLWMPMAGLGMNIGVGDAAHLAWMLSAVHSGWAGPRLLDAYGAERRPVAAAMSTFATGVARHF
jgi:2-polyprenyl-6-methoxyphenol hydroxylase-like FAD-dependent oxidoreductase